MYCASALYLKSSNCYSINDDDDDDHTCVVQFKPKKKQILMVAFFFLAFGWKLFHLKLTEKNFFVWDAIIIIMDDDDGLEREH